MSNEMFDNATSIRIGDRWIHGVVIGSAKVSGDWVTFECGWSKARSGYRRFTVLLDEITAVEEDSA